MTEVLWPLDLCPSSQTWNIIGNAATFTSPLSGATRTYGRPGARLGCTMTFPPMKGQDRARLLAFINTLLDRSNRAWVPDFSTTRRGSFSVSELLTNNDFSNGTTGWAVSGGAISAADRVLRMRASSGGSQPSLSQSVALTQYVPHVLRSFLADGRGTSGVNVGRTLDGITNDYSVSRGMGAIAHVGLSGTASDRYPAVIASISGYGAGDYIECHWASISQCALVDGGANLIVDSDDADGAQWVDSDAVADGNSTPAPDGTATAQYLAETTANAAHFTRQDVTVASAEADYAASFYVKGFNRSWCYVQLMELTGNTSIFAYVNLSSGAVGTTSTGANWGNLRTFVENCGDSWYRICIVGRKTNAATGLRLILGAATADNTGSYVGVTSPVALLWWRASLARSSVPVRAVGTAAAVAASAQTGTGIYVKGLPASTQGLLEAGDPVQIGGQINFLTARLDSDAAGRGYLQCGRPWLAATNDAPVIVHQPMCKMILATDTIDIDTGPGQFSPFQIELVEAIE